MFKPYPFPPSLQEKSGSLIYLPPLNCNAISINGSANHKQANWNIILAQDQSDIPATGVIFKLTLVATFTMITLNKSVYGQHLITKEITDIYLKRSAVCILTLASRGSAVGILLSVCILPLVCRLRSAVCGLQSAVLLSAFCIIPLNTLIIQYAFVASHSSRY